MNELWPSQTINFNFEGEFLGFAEPSHKCKYVRIQALSQELQIKVAKKLRPFVKFVFRAGERVQISGIGKFDHKTCELKLKATRMIPLAIAQPDLAQPQYTTLPQLDYSAVSQPRYSTERKPKIKIRVCQKSKCLKRGGKSLCESMEAALKDWNLQDQIAIEPTGCLGRCSSAPNLMVHPGKQLHSGICVNTLPKFERMISTLLTPGKN